MNNLKGRVSGFIVAGYGLAAFFFNFVAKAVVNPDNVTPTVKVLEDGVIIKYFSEDIANNVPKMFQILAACWVVMGYLAILIIKVPKEMIKKDPSLKSTQIEFHCFHNQISKSETNIDFHNRHTYANNLYFGMGGLIKSKSYQPVHEKNSPTDHKKIKIEMKNIENHKEEQREDFLANDPVSLKHKLSVASNPEKIHHPFQNESQDHPHTFQNEEGIHSENELRRGLFYDILKFNNL